MSYHSRLKNAMNIYFVSRSAYFSLSNEYFSRAHNFPYTIFPAVLILTNTHPMS